MRRENKSLEVEVFNNLWGNPRGINEILIEQPSASWYIYKLVLFVAVDPKTDPPMKYYNLKYAVHDDISIARVIGFQLFKAELEWQELLSVEQDDKMGIALIFQPFGGDNLIVESSSEALAPLTEIKREEEKVIFQKLGKEYPERDFS